MTKVEELRDYFWHLLHGSDLHKLDVLIITPHAEGVAEGAEQERERILMAAHFAVNLTGNGLGNWIVPYLLLKPVSVLALTKEES